MLARKANIARRHGLKPAKAAAIKTAIVDDKLRPLRVLLATLGDGFALLSLAEATDKIHRVAIAKKNEMAQCRIDCIELLVERKVIKVRYPNILGNRQAISAKTTRTTSTMS